jgi:hypothetical protein
MDFANVKFREFEQPNDCRSAPVHIVFVCKC